MTQVRPDTEIQAASRGALQLSLGTAAPPSAAIAPSIRALRSTRPVYTHAALLLLLALRGESLSEDDAAL